MKRSDVYDIIDTERNYQDNKPGHTKERDESLSVAEWIIYMNNHLSKAMDAVYDMNEEAALEEIRKVTALGVACMEHNETKPRE